LKDGGKIYLHESQTSNSYLAGKVLDWIQDPRPEKEDRKIFICKKVDDVKSGSNKNWAQEKAYDFI
jgi:hypothetical protein